MHEIGYCEALLPAVERRATGRTVTRIGIRAGTRHRLVPEVVQMAWSHIAATTPYGDAVTVLHETPMHAQCPSCAHEFTTDDTLAECPQCGLVGPRLSGGDEFALEWLEFSDSDGIVPQRAEEPLHAPGHDPDDHHEHDLDELQRHLHQHVGGGD